MLLGLRASAAIPLVGRVALIQPDADQVQQALTDCRSGGRICWHCRPAIAPQNAAVRGAILAQFPALTLGFNTARDTSAVYTKGFSIGISLPLFDRNRGNIAIERATRLQLKDAYAERLLNARSDVQRLQPILSPCKGSVRA